MLFVRMIRFTDIYSTSGGGIVCDLGDRRVSRLHTTIYESGGETGDFCSPKFLRAKVFARQSFCAPKFLRAKI